MANVPRPADRGARRMGPPAARGGFTIIEMVMALSFLLVSLVGVGLAIHAGVRTTRELRERQIVQTRAQMYVDRLVRLNFGESSDPEPTRAQLEELFDDDTDLGTVTLMSLTRYPRRDGGWTFERKGFPVPGSWTVQVTQDLDGDGAVGGDLEEDGLLVRITVSFDGEAILTTIRGKETQT